MEGTTTTLDSRPVYGWGGSVELTHWDGADGLADPTFVVAIIDRDGTTVYTRNEDTIASAYSAWKHVFSFADAPNPFARTPDEDTDETSSDVVERIADYTTPTS